MTKEKLFEELTNCETEFGFNATDISDILHKFFSQNVCTPKGENRHPYADVLHEWIEGTDIQKTTGNDCWQTMINISEFMDITATTLSQEYRIKPSEAVYEYLYYSPEGSIKWMTTQESEPDVYFIQAKVTKRIRQ